MEGQTPSRNGTKKTEFARNGTCATNSAAKETLENSCYVKRNGASFVLTAPSGRITTTKAKTRLSFDSSNSSAFASNRPKETPRSSKESLISSKETITISNSTPRKLEDTGCASSLQSLTLSKGENSGSNFKKRSKDALKYLITSPGKLDRNTIWNSREITCSASENSKRAVNNEGETPTSKKRTGHEGEIHVIHEKLSRRSSTACASRQSFGGSKVTPTSKQRGHKLSLAPSRHRAEAASKLKAMENAEMQASRLAQAKKDLWLDRQERAYCAWLNSVLRQPMKEPDHSNSSALTENGAGSAIGTPCHERDILFVGSENESYWHTPKRPRLKLSRAPSYDGSKSMEKFRAGSSQSVEACLQNVCSVSDLRQRLAIYLDAPDLEEVLSTMVKLAKHVEDGRFKMKEECPILTDLGLREKAVQVLMNYNPSWLRIGLYIVLGHNTLVTKEKPSILCNGNFSDGVNVEEGSEFLKLVIEKHFFTHAGLSKSYSSNKSIGGLYRPGYYDALGKVILKRFFLFVLALDKIKCQSTLPIRNGIDGLDGGSPLLFWRNTAVKSSRQVLQDFLSDVMHGEGDLLSRLATVGYQVSHVQMPLAEYDFRVENLIENLRDGIHLCRLVQILLQNTSVLMRVVVPCDSHKKSIHNCTVALQYLHDAGVPLMDEEGYDLTPEDVVLGDRERTLSLLWHMFVHFQIPLLLRKEQLSEEITKIRGPEDQNLMPLLVRKEQHSEEITKIRGPEDSNMVKSLSDAPTMIEMMLKWIQAICATYGKRVDNFKSSFADGEPFYYLVDFYLPGYMSGTQYLKDAQVTDPLELVVTSATEASTPKYSLVQDVIKRLYNIPEFIKITDFLEGDPSCNERNVIIMLAFLSARLLEGKPMIGSLSCTLQNSMGSGNAEKTVPVEHTEQKHCISQEQMAAIKIQSFYRSFIQRQHYLRIKLGQSEATQKLSCTQAQEKAVIRIQSWRRALTERRQFLRIKAAAIHIQSATRAWLSAKKLQDSFAVSVIQERRQEKAATRIQSVYRVFMKRKQFLKLEEADSDMQSVKNSCTPYKCQNGNAHYLSTCFEIQKNSEEAATVIQSHYRGFVQRQQFLKMKSAVSYLQCTIRAWLAARHLDENGSLSTCSRVEDVRQEEASTVIQAHYRGLTARRQFRKSKAAISLLQSVIRAWIAATQKKQNGLHFSTFCTNKESIETITSSPHTVHITKAWAAAIVIQSHIRGWLQRSRYVLLVSNVRKIQLKYREYKHHMNKNKAAVKIQCAWKRALSQSKFSSLRYSAIKIQSYWRGYLARSQFKEQKAASTMIQSWYRTYKCHNQYKLCREGSIKIQSYWRGYLARSQFKEQKAASTMIQSWYRTYKCHNQYKLCREASIKIQSYWRGYLARSQFKEQKAASTMIQSWYRTYKCHNQYKLCREASIKIQSYWRGYLARSQFKEQKAASTMIQSWYRTYKCHNQYKLCREASIKIQSYWRGYLARSQFKEQKAASTMIQSWYRTYKCHNQYKLCREASIKIQSAIRGRLVLQSYLKYKDAACKVQRCFRGWLVRKELQQCIKVDAYNKNLLSRNQTNEDSKLNHSATVIQAAFRGWKERQIYKMKFRMVVRVQAIFRGVQVRRNLLQNDVVGCMYADVQLLSKSAPQKTAIEAAITIQRFYRGYVARSQVFARAQHANHDLFYDVCILNTKKARLEHILNKYIGFVKQRRYFLKARHSALKLQKWWRKVLALRSQSAVVIQSHFRGWLSRKLFRRTMSNVVLIQACWRGLLVRKNQVDTRQQLSNLRFRIKNSAVNVDDRLRLENRVTEALEVLLNHKTVSGILHTCATLDVATQHSKRCCERLVAAGAIDKLFQLIHSTNRSAPHEQVLKHALSVLCNIAYYPELAQLVVDTPGSINRIAEQLLRNKDEGFSKAAEVLKKLCAVKDGVDAVRKLPSIIRRLKNLAQNLERKVELERRNLATLPQNASDATRKAGERRLRETVSQRRSMIHLLQCITGESSRRQSEVHKFTPRSDHVLKRASGGSTELSRRDNRKRFPFQDFSNK